MSTNPPEAPAEGAAGLLAVAGEVLVGLAMGFVLQLAFAAPTIAESVFARCISAIKDERVAAAEARHGEAEDRGARSAELVAHGLGQGPRLGH